MSDGPSYGFLHEWSEYFMSTPIWTHLHVLYTVIIITSISSITESQNHWLYAHLKNVQIKKFCWYNIFEYVPRIILDLSQ